MQYLVDTCILRELLDHFPKKGKFRKDWECIEKGFELGSIISVDECLRELQKRYAEGDMKYNWLKIRGASFLEPTSNETVFIRHLFLNKKAQELIHEKNLLSNLPAADPYILAKANEIDAVIVTNEIAKPNSSCIPTIAQKYNIECIGYEQFMEAFFENIKISENDKQI